MPALNGSRAGLDASGDIARAKAAALHKERVMGVESAREKHARDSGGKA
jgi:hypothetical protein